MEAYAIEGDTLTTTHAGCDVAVKLAEVGGRWVPISVTIDSGAGIAAEAVRTLPLRAIEAAANRDVVRWALKASELLSVSARKPRLKLSVPSGPGRKPDKFYQQVAEAYSYLAMLNRGPAAALAVINEVPVTTVHRWVKEARARGLLAPGQKGRAT